MTNDKNIFDRKNGLEKNIMTGYILRSQMSTADYGNQLINSADNGYHLINFDDTVKNFMGEYMTVSNFLGIDVFSVIIQNHA